MAITHTTLYNSRMNDIDSTKVAAIYNAILAAYPWNTGSEVTVDNDITLTYAVYYFTANSYIKISNYVPHNYGVKIEIVTPSGTKTVKLNDCFYTFSVGKTSKGICICAYSGSTALSRDPQFYNLYIGEITKLDGTTAQGCIYTADDGTLTIATDSGISEESAQNSVISADRKAVLIPVVNTTTGDIFSDIFIMRYSPLQYNIMDVDGQGVFLCGKALVLKD